MRGMARPPKKPVDRKSYHLRVPLAAEQRALIETASQLTGQDKAAWARAVLLEAARKLVEKGKASGIGAN